LLLLPDWIAIDKAEMTATITRLPESAEIDARVDTRMVVEYYSR